MRGITKEQIIEEATKQGINLDPSLLKEYPLGTWFWCIHHSVIVEKLTEPLLERVWYILDEKPSSEREVRLQALRPVVGEEKLPVRLVQASAEYDRACAEYDRACAEYDVLLQAQRRNEYPDCPSFNSHGLVF